MCHCLSAGVLTEVPPPPLALRCCTPETKLCFTFRRKTQLSDLRTNNSDRFTEPLQELHFVNQKKRRRRRRRTRRWSSRRRSVVSLTVIISSVQFITCKHHQLLSIIISSNQKMINDSFIDLILKQPEVYFTCSPL